MPGLIDTSMGQGAPPPAAPPAAPPAPAPAAAPPAAGPAGPQAQGGTEPATPEEQQAYDRVMEQIGTVLYSEKGQSSVLALVEKSNDPANGIAEAATALVAAQDDKVDGRIPEGIMLPLGAETAELIAELAEHAGLIQDADGMMETIGRYLVADMEEAYGSEPDEIEEFLQSMGADAQPQPPPPEQAPLGDRMGAMPPPGLVNGAMGAGPQPRGLVGSAMGGPPVG